MEGPLTRTADVPARELVSQIPREAASAGVDPQPETLRSRAALLYEAMDDSLIPRLQVKEPHSRRIDLDTAITLCPEYAVARYREPDFLVHARHFRTCLAYALSLRVTRARRGVRWCTDSGWSLPTLERHQRMTNRGKTLGNSADTCGRDSLHTGTKYITATGCQHHGVLPNGMTRWAGRRIRKGGDP